MRVQEPITTVQGKRRSTTASFYSPGEEWILKVPVTGVGMRPKATGSIKGQPTDQLRSVEMIAAPKNSCQDTVASSIRLLRTTGRRVARGNGKRRNHEEHEGRERDEGREARATVKEQLERVSRDLG